MNIANEILNIMKGKYFKVLVDQRYKFNRLIQKAEENELREVGFEQDIVITAFRWKVMSVDFIREIVENFQAYKSILERELIYDLYDYSVHASAFYLNMYNYIKAGCAINKDLCYYIQRVGELYMQQLNKEKKAAEEIETKSQDQSALYMEEVMSNMKSNAMKRKEEKKEKDD